MQEQSSSGLLSSSIITRQGPADSISESSLRQGAHSYHQWYLATHLCAQCTASFASC